MSKNIFCRHGKINFTNASALADKLELIALSLLGARSASASLSARSSTIFARFFNLQSLVPEKGVSRIGYAFGHNCKSIV